MAKLQVVFQVSVKDIIIIIPRVLLIYTNLTFVHECFPEGGDAILSVFSSESLRAKL